MSKFRDWYIRNQDAISWFVIGVLADQTLVQLSRHDYVGAAISAVLAVINYYFVKVRV